MISVIDIWISLGELLAPSHLQLVSAFDCFTYKSVFISVFLFVSIPPGKLSTLGVFIPVYWNRQESPMFDYIHHLQQLVVCQSPVPYLEVRHLVACHHHWVFRMMMIRYMGMIEVSHLPVHRHHWGIAIFVYTPGCMFCIFVQGGFINCPLKS